MYVFCVFFSARLAEIPALAFGVTGGHLTGSHGLGAPREWHGRRTALPWCLRAVLTRREARNHQYWLTLNEFRKNVEIVQKPAKKHGFVHYLVSPLTLRVLRFGTNGCVFLFSTHTQSVFYFYRHRHHHSLNLEKAAPGSIPRVGFFKAFDLICAGLPRKNGSPATSGHLRAGEQAREVLSAADVRWARRWRSRTAPDRVPQNPWIATWSPTIVQR